MNITKRGYVRFVILKIKVKLLYKPEVLCKLILYYGLSTLFSLMVLPIAFSITNAHPYQSVKLGLQKLSIPIHACHEHTNEYQVDRNPDFNQLQREPVRRYYSKELQSNNYHDTDEILQNIKYIRQETDNYLIKHYKRDKIHNSLKFKNRKRDERETHCFNVASRNVHC